MPKEERYQVGGKVKAKIDLSQISSGWLVAKPGLRGGTDGHRFFTGNEQGGHSS